MKAAIYLGKKSIEIRNLQKPVVGENDVLIKNLYSSVCGTDAAVYYHGPNTGHKITVGGEFGHETVSVIAEVGKNVTDFKIGERVYPYPLFTKKDRTRAGTIGGFSEYILVENAKRNYNLYSVDERISDKLASLIEPFTVGCRAARRGMIPQGEKVYLLGQNAVVFGAGTIGLAAAVSFKYFGMEKVMVCDRSAFRLNLAKNLGFEVCNVDSETFTEKTQAYFGVAPSLTGKTANIDCWLDAAGADTVFNEFMDYGKIESRFVSVAVNKKPRQFDLLRLTYSQKSVIGSGGYMPEDFYDVMRIMSCGKWDLESIITREFALDDLELAIQAAADVDDTGNVVIKMQ